MSDTTTMAGQEDYLRYRGKCKIMSEELCKADPTLRLVRGYYYCPVWGEQAHWWCVDTTGRVVDPTKDQFPSKGGGLYREFDGTVTCEQCGKEMEETSKEVIYYGNYAFCSKVCVFRCCM